MAFCEECGARLADGVKFCEECGAKVSDYTDAMVSDKDEFAHYESDSDLDFPGLGDSKRDWLQQWKEFAEKADGELGVIITRESKLLSQFEDATSAILRSMLKEYIANAAKRGVRYFYCNLDDCVFHNGGSDVEGVVASLRKIVDMARPKYMFILGNEDVIDVARWENEAQDDDEMVESDLCYSTLDVNTPWNGQKYNFDEIMRVGRLPSFNGETLASYSRYFKNAQQYIGTMSGVYPYGLSALVWEDESNDEYKEISDEKVEVSPEVTEDDVGNGIEENVNLLFFNLHGSNNARFWYGQEGCSYPEAFAPNVLDGRRRPYFLGVEACYGARYLGGLDPSNSILMMAMRNKCLAFLGSSKIAFGTSKPKGSCADIVIGDYIKYLAKGYSAGDAYVEGLRRLAASRDGMDDSDIKTLAEFALYGDPSARMGTNKDVGGIKKFFKGFGLQKGLSIPMPDVRRCVQMALAEVDAKIEAIIDEFAMRNLIPELKEIGLGNVRQSVFKMKNTGLNQKIYSLEAGPIRRIAKVYFDDKGKICKALVSK